MTNYLIDTHTLLWMRFDEEKLSDKVRGIVENRKNKLFVSVATLWEITIKYSLDKIILPDKPDVYLSNVLFEDDLQILPISPIHALRLYTIPQLHRDPFDRMLIIQSIIDRLPLITKDEAIQRYHKFSLKTVW